MTSIDRPRDLVALLGLRPHPEGGHYAETFRSTTSVRPVDGRPRRTALTQIYYLLARGEHSRWHRVRSDEAWHHLEGDPLELLTLDEERGELQRAVLGPAAGGAGGPRPQCVVPAGRWQAARPLGAYALAGCAVAPGFEFTDFTFLAADGAASAALRRNFPEAAALL